MTLYELTGALAELVDELENAETDAERGNALERFDALGIDLAEKCEGYARAMLNLSAEAEALSAESARLKALAERKKSAVERLKQGVHTAMIVAGARKLETDIGTWARKQNPPKCEIVNAERVPEEYLTPQPPKVDKKAILAAYKDTGEIVPGTEIVRGESVAFR